MDLDDLLEPFQRRGVDLGLGRLQAALAAGGNPQQRFRAVQVAGTNGKGSICTFLQTILRRAGWRVGSYRSPHLVSWCERIQIHDAWIEPSQLRSDLQHWQAIGRRHDLTPFELLTAAAFDRFAQSQLDLVILEVGLGGRLDATTAHPQRPVIGMASIGLDHCEHLGATLPLIAREKAGVMSPGAAVFSAPQEPSVAAVLQQEADRLDCRLHWLEPLACEEEGGPPLALAGRWQQANAAVAAAMARALGEPARPVTETAILEGLATARWPGRLERRQWRGRPLWIDGAHNPPAAQVLGAELQRLAPASGPQRRRWLLGIQRHKQAAEMLQALLQPGDEARIVPIPGHRCWQREELIAERPGLRFQLADSEGMEADLDWLTAGEAVQPVIAGSLHLLGEVIPWLDAPC